MKLTCRFLSTAVGVSLCIVPFLSARETIVSGGISSGVEFYDRHYTDSTMDGSQAGQDGESTSGTGNGSREDDDYSRLRIAPLVRIRTLTVRDELSLRYVPGFRYDFNTYEHDVDHDLSLQGHRFFTRNWQVSLTDRYIFSDKVEDLVTEATGGGNDSERGTVDRDSLSDNNGRRTYWTNSFSLDSSYTYQEESTINLGYIWSILENEDDTISTGYENYHKHDFSAGIVHRFNSIWNLSAETRYVRGLYDTNGLIERFISEETGEQEERERDNDLSEYRTNATLAFNKFEHNPLSFGYSFFGVAYDDPGSDDNVIHNLTFNWQWIVLPDIKIDLGGGPSYEKTEGRNGNWGYNAQTGLTYTMARGEIRFSADRGYDRQNFSGVNENGLQEYWQARLDVQYLIVKDLSVSLYTSYRDQDREQLASGDQATGSDVSTTDIEINVFNQDLDVVTPLILK